VQGQPTHLAALVRWFMDAAQDDSPQRIHSRDTADDGDPEWHPSFRAYLMAHPAATDREGHVRSPFRFWLWIMRGQGRRGRVGAEFLYDLARLEGDWLAAARRITPLTEDGEIMARSFAVDILQQFWRYMNTEPRRHVREKSDAQHAAEENA
jgi:hypothetical protein